MGLGVFFFFLVGLQGQQIKFVKGSMVKCLGHGLHTNLRIVLYINLKSINDFPFWRTFHYHTTLTPKRMAKAIKLPYDPLLWQRWDAS